MWKNSLSVPVHSRSQSQKMPEAKKHFFNVSVSTTVQDFFSTAFYSHPFSAPTYGSLHTYLCTVEVSNFVVYQVVSSRSKSSVKA